MKIDIFMSSGEKIESKKTLDMRTEIDECMHNKKYSKVKQKLKEYHDLMLQYEYDYAKYPQYLSDTWRENEWNIYYDFLRRYMNYDLELSFALFRNYKTTDNPYLVQI